jgi:cytochrome c oxidase assembly factor CtaG
LPAFVLHAGHSVGLGSWHLEPSIFLGTALALALYVFQAARMGAAVSEWRILSYVGGALAMFLALASPLDAAAHESLSMHMLQHVLLTTIGPPLVLLGLTPGLLAPVLRNGGVVSLLRRATNPVFCAAVFIVNMWLWHIPPVYEQALQNLGVHIAMHVSFITTGLLFWVPIVQPLAFNRIHEGGRLLYLFAAGFPMELLALMLLASGSVLYSYYEGAGGVWGISPLADQQIAGLIMGVLGQAASAIAATLLFFRFLDREEAPRQRGPFDAA